MQRFLLVVCSVVFVGCAAPGGNGSNEPSLADNYTLKVFVNPPAPAPNAPVFIIAQVQSKEDSSALKGAVVQLAASLGDSKIELVDFQEQSNGTYRLNNLAFPAQGDWKVTIFVSANELSMSATLTVMVSCSGGGNEGDTCCSVDDCNTDQCIDFKCEYTPTCTDNKANGNESSVDCGGPDCVPCLNGESCNEHSDCVTENCEAGVCSEVKAPLLSKDGKEKSKVTLTLIEDSLLKDPNDLRFNPNAPNELWVVNKEGESFVVITNPGQAGQKTVRYLDLSHHFMEKVLAISFGDSGTMATCGESRNDYHGLGPPSNDFMGPVMWPGNQAELIKYGSPDVSMAHLDMLHNTPYCMGITADTGNAYYVYNGLMGTVEWYDFLEPHPDGWDGHGGVDHKDGLKKRYVGLGLKREANVPSTMHYDSASGWLYIADTGNSRLIRFKPGDAQYKNKSNTYPDEKPIDIYQVQSVEELIPKSSDTLFHPSGLLFHKKITYISDAMTSLILAFDEDWKLIEIAHTGLSKNSLAGITVGPDDKMYLVDRNSHRIFRLDP